MVKIIATPEAIYNLYELDDHDDKPSDLWGMRSQELWVCGLAQDQRERPQNKMMMMNKKILPWWNSQRERNAAEMAWEKKRVGDS